MLIIKSFAATAALSLSAKPVTVVMPMPVEKSNPTGKLTFAPDEGGIINEKYTEAPAVGVPAVL